MSFLRSKADNGWNRESVSTAAQALRSFFRHAERRGWCKPGIAAGIQGPKIYQYSSILTNQGLSRSNPFRASRNTGIGLMLFLLSVANISSRPRDLGRAQRRSSTLCPLVEEASPCVGGIRTVVQLREMVERNLRLGAGGMGCCSQDF
jgi:hypothetical protein